MLGWERFLKSQVYSPKFDACHMDTSGLASGYIVMFSPGSSRKRRLRVLWRYCGCADKCYNNQSAVGTFFPNPNHMPRNLILPSPARPLFLIFLAKPFPQALDSPRHAGQLEKCRENTCLCREAAQTAAWGWINIHLVK